jgi:hypothetical protein
VNDGATSWRWCSRRCCYPDIGAVECNASGSRADGECPDLCGVADTHLRDAIAGLVRHPNVIAIEGHSRRTHVYVDGLDGAIRRWPTAGCRYCRLSWQSTCICHRTQCQRDYCRPRRFRARRGRRRALWLRFSLLVRNPHVGPIISQPGGPPPEGKLTAPMNRLPLPTNCSPMSLAGAAAHKRAPS